MIDILFRAGPVGFLIVVSSVMAFAAFVERLIRLQQARIDTNRFLQELSRALSERNVGEALRVCDRVQSPISRVARVGLVHVNEPQERLRNRLEHVALVEIPLLERNMSLLSTVAHIAPLLGLLGTVAGMIRAFQVIQAKASYVSPADLAQGIWVALLTTAMGLIVAIPCLIGYNYLRDLIQIIRTDMERAATLVIDFALTHYEISNPARNYQHQA